MKKTIMTLLMATSLTMYGQNRPEPKNVLDLKSSITDSQIVFPESYEADTHKLLESWFLKNYTSVDTTKLDTEDVAVSDEVMMKRLASLPTIIEMPYNQIVRSYIERYTGEGRRQVSALLGLSIYYMPIFEQALEEQGLPLELKYLPLIESGLDPNAVSRHGATGLWQFMLGTAKGLGMEVNSLIDERRDPYLSSEIAASYLKTLYEAYGDWTLAIAAYNCGPGNVNKAIRRAGGESKDHDFWSIYGYLPAETRGYVPMFIAANYVMTYYPEHNISPVLPVKPLVMDTIHVGERIHFNQISNVLDIPVDELRILNPQFRADIIPGSEDVTYNLILPSQQIHAYLMSEDDIRNFDADKYIQRLTVEPGDSPSDVLMAVEETEIWPDSENSAPRSSSASGAKTTVIHKVVSGETLGSIAALYEVTPEEIKKTNNLRRNAVRIGQQLRITTSAPQAMIETTVAAVNSGTKKQNTSSSSKGNTTSSKSESTSKKSQAASTPSTHKIKSGESLSSISKKYGVSIAELKKANGMTNDNLRAGATLKIPSKQSAASSKKSTSSSKSKKTTKSKKKR